ncbi:RES domain-containing protein [Photobacterium sp. WH77]|uniref:RES domain-containing protein n=1 Tax=unclassified Photobacterium TaxID=2628852 RepID=UPI001EDA1B6A|nr:MULTISPECIES: RES domain-containing protein [unclassified Photobacterium]MCG2835320.1 RES domain-containing protein [Photobacterium sp. WH77]MCG2842933.1 RES domain-containing protein [Photobacterium sp. WH80]
MSKCCINCFNDKEIKQSIINRKELGRCSYCGSNDISVADACSLNEKFEFLMYGAEPCETGQPAYIILTQAFEIFGNDVKNPQKLLDDILSTNLGDIKYSLKFETERYINGWSELCQELKHNNRFFLKSEVYETFFSSDRSNSTSPFFSILEQLELLVYPEDEFYRARIADNHLTRDDMGAPPSEIATAGRANPKGISYVYLADNIETCISEVRPYNGCEIHVSKFKSTNGRRLIDLTSPRKAVSVIPFSEIQYGEVLSIIDLLESFSKELSIPVKPHLSELEYIPTQFLCEYIKSLDCYDGIVFKSSFGKGNNYVFFERDNFTVEAPLLHKLDDITFTFST